MSSTPTHLLNHHLPNQLAASRRERPGWRSGYTTPPYRPWGTRRLCTATSTAATWVCTALPWLSRFGVHQKDSRDALESTVCSPPLQGLTHPQTVRRTQWDTHMAHLQEKGTQAQTPPGPHFHVASSSTTRLLFKMKCLLLTAGHWLKKKDAVKFKPCKGISIWIS